MQVQALSCARCGAPLDIPAGARFVTCGHCGVPLVIHRAAPSAYTAVLERLDTRTARLGTTLEAIHRQGDLAQIDREWAIERDQYRSADDGQLPSGAGAVASVLAVLVVVGFIGVILAVANPPGVGPTGAWSSPAPPLAAPVGEVPGFVIVGAVVAVLITLVGAGLYLARLQAYRAAEASYQRRRVHVAPPPAPGPPPAPAARSSAPSGSARPGRGRGRPAAPIRARAAAERVGPAAGTPTIAGARRSRRGEPRRAGGGARRAGQGPRAGRLPLERRTSTRGGA